MGHPHKQRNGFSVTCFYWEYHLLPVYFKIFDFSFGRGPAISLP